MGTRSGPYSPDFPVGTPVRIKSEPELRQFQGTWKAHNPLRDEQLAYAERVATVQEVGFYHGADELYVLAGVPGVWHEQCLVEGSPLSQQEQVRDDHTLPLHEAFTGRTPRTAFDGQRPGPGGEDMRRDFLIVLVAAGLFALLTGGVFAARGLERDLADLHGPVGLIALGPAVVLYTIGALFLLVVWKRNRHTMRGAVAVVALAPVVILMILAVRVCYLLALPAG
jgi:hypothetical protein